MQRVLVAGATGHIGSHMVRALHDAGCRVRALARDEHGLAPVRDACDDIFVGEATRHETLKGLCSGIDTVVSSLGLRTFRSHPTAEEVDLQANLNILKSARNAGVKRFVFVGVLNAAQLIETVPILRPREEFIRHLQASGLAWTVLRPTGAFNDLQEAFRLAERGWGIVVGSGCHRINPIHAADIAAVAVQAITQTSLNNVEFGFGGPETYTQAGIVELAFRALGKQQRTLHVPPWAIDAATVLVRPFNRNAAGFMEFFRRTATTEMVGTPLGEHSLAEFYNALAHTARLGETRTSI